MVRTSEPRRGGVGNGAHMGTTLCRGAGAQLRSFRAGGNLAFPGIYLWRDPHGALYLVDPTGTRLIPPPD